MTLAGRSVLVTGAARGIGAELARRFARRGARVALAGLEEERLAALAAELGPAHRWFPCDVTRQPTLDAAVAGAVDAFGGLDVVVANAGVAARGTVAVTPVEALARTVDVNLTGVVRTASAALPHLARSRGYLLLVGSASAVAPMPGLAVYAATKSAVEQFGNVLRLEVRRDGVGVGVALPSWVDTDLVRDFRRDLSAFEQALRTLPPPFNRVTPVEECAEALVRAVERRARRVFVPASVAPFAAVRQLFASALSDRILGRVAARLLPAADAEARALGRAFGARSAAEGVPNDAAAPAGAPEVTARR